MVNKGLKVAVWKFIEQSIAIICACFFLIPFYFAFINALRDPISVPTIAPPNILYWNNFIEAVTMIPFWSYLRSSLIITTISVSLAVIMNFLFGYSFARLKAPYKDVWFTILISLMMVPEVATLIPQFTLFNNWGVYDTYLIWILVGLGGSSYYTFLFRQFLQGIPLELEEAARIDGCSVYQTIWHIFVPLSKPVIVIVFMFEFISTWGDSVKPFMFLSDMNWPLACALMGNRYTLPQNPHIIRQPLQLAASFLFIIPSFIVYLIGQKYVKAGMITSGLKG